MRKEIGWNAGMHSHPECLNKLSMNEAVNTGEQKTTITRTDVDIDHPERENEIKMCLYTQVHYRERAESVFFVHTHPHTPKRHPDVLITEVP